MHQVAKGLLHDPKLLPLLGWALSESGDSAGARVRGHARKDPVSPADRLAFGPTIEPRSAPRASRSEPALRGLAEAVREPASPETRAEETPPVSDPQPPPRSARRFGGSDIEDFLL